MGLSGQKKRKCGFARKKTDGWAVILLLGALTAGCGSSGEPHSSSAAEPAAAKGETQAAADSVRPAGERAAGSGDDSGSGTARLIDPALYAGTAIGREQIDLLNDLLAAQNAGDARGYAALFATDTPETETKIEFGVERIGLYAGSAESNGTAQVEGAVRETTQGSDHPIVYTLERETDGWRIGGIKRAQGPYADETGYAGESAEIVKLINAGTRYRNAGDAQAYAKLFRPDASMRSLDESPGKVEETLIPDIGFPNGDGTLIVNVLQRYEGQTDVHVRAFALGKEGSRWIILDID